MKEDGENAETVNHGRKKREGENIIIDYIVEIKAKLKPNYVLFSYSNKEGNGFEAGKLWWRRTKN